MKIEGRRNEEQRREIKSINSDELRDRRKQGVKGGGKVSERSYRVKGKKGMRVQDRRKEEGNRTKEGDEERTQY